MSDSEFQDKFPTEQEIIQKAKEFLLLKEHGYVFRSLSTIAEHIGINKVELLRIFSQNQEFITTFDTQRYNPENGPLVALVSEAQDYFNNLPDQQNQADISGQKDLIGKILDKIIKSDSSPPTPSSSSPKKISKKNKEKIRLVLIELNEIYKRLNSVISESYLDLAENNAEYANDLHQIQNLMASTISNMISYNSISQKDLGMEK